jgi:lipopolysaccharide export system permease protein
MLSILDRYMIKQILIATIFVAIILSVLVLLTQSLKFLELVINAGASGLSFWLMTMLALPRFLEIVVPIGLMAGVLFVYNRLLLDSELIAMKGLGFSPLTLARPAILLSFGLAVFLMIAMAWIVPQSNNNLQEKRQELRSVITNFLFRENVFNDAGKGLMVYVRERDSNGNLYGLIVHDARDPTKTPSTIIAKKGILVTSDKGEQVIVYNGSRQDFDAQKNVLRRLNFDQYTIDLPQSDTPLNTRWREPDERTSLELLSNNLSNAEDRNRRADFILELHKRFSNPLLVVCFTIIGLYCLLLGSLDRRGLNKKILMAVGLMVAIQVSYMVSYNLSKTNQYLIPFMYLVPVLPALFCFLKLWRPYSVPNNKAVL